jgi:NAD(P)-dependent dehydrogenase (short-subunit alcohol dehydrogenase family)
MNTFKDKVAVVTGAASGIGRGIAERCAKEGMKVVLADIEEKPLTKAEQDLKATGASVLSVLTDVSKASEVQKLAQKTLDEFKSVHFLFNNAGVGAGTTIWESTIADWEWTLGVNLWGVIHGVRTFVPIMLKQDTECYIVNTASMAGLVSGPYNGVYKVTKHGVVTLSETLYSELNQINAKIHVSVLCPGFIKTNILSSDRNRPPELKNDPEFDTKMMEREDVKFFYQFIEEGIETGMHPNEVADCILKAIQEKKFYILANPGDMKRMADLRAEDVIHERNPTSIML